jgi:hypothetical protein
MRHVLPVAAVAVVIIGATLAFAVSLRPRVSSGNAAKQASSASPAGIPAASSLGRSPVPQVNLTGLRWSDFYGVELPFSAQAGPRDTAGDLAAGFAHSPLGALLAAINIAVRANAQWGPRVFTAVIRDQVTGPDAAALLADCLSVYGQASRSAGVTGGQPLGNVDVAEEAFRWVAYTPDAAVIDLVSAGPGSQGATVRATIELEVVWDGGDWKVIAPPGGDWGNSAAELSSLTGYTLFPGPWDGR